MITYCMEREKGGERKVVQMPDRSLSNLDKVAYTRQNDECDYEGFLSKMYQRRAKDKHSKSIRCGNELWSRSKKTTDLNMIRGAATDRDKYLCQIQLYYTGKIAKERVLGRRSSVDSHTSYSEGGDVVEEKVIRRSRRSVSAEPEDEVWEEETRKLDKRVGRQGAKYVMKDILSTGQAMTDKPEEEDWRQEKRRNVIKDGRYGPGFIKNDTLDYRKVSLGRVSALELVGVHEPEPLPGLDLEKLEARAVGEAKDKYLRYEQGRKVAGEFIDANTQEEFLKLDSKLRKKREEANKKEYKPLYNDTSYIKALKDVQRRVKDKGRPEHPKCSIDDINVNYRRRRIEDIGRYERATILSEMHKNPHIPDFDVGYDTVDRLMVCSK